MADLTNFTIGQSETFKILVEVEEGTDGLPLDITNYTFEGSLRENYSTDYNEIEFTITKISPFESGSIFLQLSSDQTLTLTQRKYVYDVYMQSGSISDTRRRLLEGQVTVRPSATR